MTCVVALGKKTERSRAESGNFTLAAITSEAFSLVPRASKLIYASPVAGQAYEECKIAAAANASTHL